MRILQQSGPLFQLLEGIDQQTAEETRNLRCRVCGGRLHRCDYPRKPRGGPVDVLNRWIKRPSFCCEREGCRTRHTPASVRFLGRKVYVGVYVVFVSAMMCGVNARRAGQLHQQLGMDPRTLKRWRQWWLQHFVSTSFWRSERSGFMPQVDETQLPGTLVEVFGEEDMDGAIALMRFLAPITTRWRQEDRVM